MKKTILQLILFAVCVLMFGCLKDNSSFEETGTLYGSITDVATGEPVSNANMSLQPGGETVLTGYDGLYQFNNLPVGNYYVTISKAGFDEVTADEMVKIAEGANIRRDYQIRKSITYISITDMYGNPLSVLDFGGEESVTSKSFNIFNNSTTSAQCEVITSCEWVKSVSVDQVTLVPGQNVTVTVVIDRSKLPNENNSTTIYVKSANSSNSIEVRASKSFKTDPEVLTLPVTNADGTTGPWMNKFNARITYEGHPPYSSRGFCYSYTNSNPTINDNRIDVAGHGEGDYSYVVNDWSWWSFTTPVVFYVRAWVIYGDENSIKYGDIQTFTYNNVK